MHKTGHKKNDSMRVILNLVQTMSENPDPEILSIFIAKGVEDRADLPNAVRVVIRFSGAMASYILAGGKEAICTVQTILGNREIAQSIHEDETAPELLRCLALTRLEVTDA